MAEKTEKNAKPAETEEEKIDRRTSAGRRIHALLERRKETEAENAHLKEHIASLENTVSQLKQDSSLPANQIEARAQELSARRDAARDFAAFRQKITDHINEQPDADKIREAAKSLPLHGALLPTLMAHPKGHMVVVELARKPDRANGLVGKPLGQQLAEIGEILSTAGEAEQAAQKAETKKEPVTSKAPKPISGVNTQHGRSHPDLSDDKMDYQDWKRLRNAGRI